jgi:hypothetical protein
MAARVAWLLNLDADEELADPRHYRPTPALEARIAALRTRMTMLLRPDDLVLPEDAALATGLAVLPFCPTPCAHERLEALGLRPFLPVPLDVLRKANSRAFSASLGQTLPHATYVRDMPALEEAIRAPSPRDAFLLKRDFSFAGRERRQARKGELDASTRGFAARSFARGEGLQVEPWLELSAEFALHGFLCADGRYLRGRPVAQQCDGQGRWLSSQIALEGPVRARAACGRGRARSCRTAPARSGIPGALRRGRLSLPRWPGSAPISAAQRDQRALHHGIST